MDKKLNKETAIIMLKVMEDAKKHMEYLQERREKKLFNEIEIPCSLNDVIYRLTKDEMSYIRKNYKLDGLGSLKKSELASELIKIIPHKFEGIIRILDQDMYDLIKSIVKNSGAIFCKDIEFSIVENFMRYGIAFPGLKNGKRILTMPVELIEEFNLLDAAETEKVIYRNTEWIQLTQGMLYYYGVMDSWRLIKNVQKYVEKNININQFVDVISLACNLYENMNKTAYGYKDARVYDSENIIAEHNKRPNIDYYQFTKNQLLKAGNPNHNNNSPEMEGFINFLLLNYDLKNDAIDEISTQLTNLINLDSKPIFIIEYLQTWLEIPSFEYLQILTAKITELSNNTRQWVLKGYTPNELFQEEKKHLKPLPSKPFDGNTAKAKIIKMTKSNKIGRNEPCPCGSGKKYKKCCGMHKNATK
ncbi:MAG TPA: zinc chelation protein SecC [Clostridiales bacterium]|jgi:hypothetical protein|nr:zinc chelation protein SecC [Clostridiales bacterium]